MFSPVSYLFSYHQLFIQINDRESPVQTAVMFWLQIREDVVIQEWPLILCLKMSMFISVFRVVHVISNNVAFWHMKTQTSLCSLLWGLETPNCVQSAAWQSWNTQATSKGSDQTARMRRVIWDFAGCTYHIVGNLMHWLNYYVLPTLAERQSTLVSHIEM